MSTDFVKQTLRENLTRVLIPHIADGLWSVYDNAKAACEQSKQPDQTIKTFQNLLTSIPKWPTTTLKQEVERITVASKCDYMEDLLMGVFVSYIRAFATLQNLEETHVDIPFERPTMETFLQALYNASARKCWSTAFLFNTRNVSSEQQARNRRDIETNLAGCLNEVIDSFIPWKEISRAYFHVKEAAKVELPVVVEAPKPPVQFGTNETKVFEKESEAEEDEESVESEEEEQPKRIVMGADVQLDLGDESETESVDFFQKPTETVTIQL